MDSESRRAAFAIRSFRQIEELLGAAGLFWLQPKSFTLHKILACCENSERLQ